MSAQGYNFSLSTTPQAGGSTKKTLSTSFVDNGVTVGKYLLSYGTWPYSSLNSGLVSLSHNLSVRINRAELLYDDKVGTGREAFDPVIHADFSSDPIPIRQSTQTSDLEALTNALHVTSVGSWFFDGHSGANNMIHGTDGYLTVDLTSRQVAALLGNSYGFVGSTNFLTYGRRLFSTFISGCGAAASGSEYPEATGTPPGVPQAGNPQIKKSAFLGFTGLSYSGGSKFGWINRVHVEWLDENDYDTALATAVNRANAAYPEVVPWGPNFFGYGPLEYNGDASR